MDREQFILQHPDIGESLRVYFAGSDELERFLADPSERLCQRHNFHIRCPHCHNAIEMVEDSSFRDVACPSCGSHFNLIGNNDRTESAQPGNASWHILNWLINWAWANSGTVWKAKDATLDRFVAIKIPRKDQLDESDIRNFFREARGTAQLRHPNIVGVHEVGREDDTIFIASDYVEGVTLKEWLEARPLPPREAYKALCPDCGRASCGP